MELRIDNPVDLVAHIPTIIERKPTFGAWYIFKVNRNFHVDAWTEHEDLPEAIVDAATGASEDAIFAIVQWGSDDDNMSLLVGDGRDAVRRIVIDCIQVFDVMHGTVRANSMLCDGENCEFCGSLIPIDPVPGQPYDGLPLAVGDMEFGTWQGSYEAAEGLVSGLLSKIEVNFDEPVFDQEEIPQLGALLGYKGGRDFMMAMCGERAAFPNMALRMIMDHGASDSPAVQNAALVLATAYWPISKGSAVRLVEWVLQQDPDHRMASLMRRLVDADERMATVWLKAFSKMVNEETYQYDLPEGAS